MHFCSGVDITLQNAAHVSEYAGLHRFIVIEGEHALLNHLTQVWDERRNWDVLE